MEITLEIRAQLDEQKKQCIFCKIISKEQESKIVFEDDLTIAVLDIYPALKGHTVFLLKEHYPIMPYIPANEFKHYFGLVPELSKAVQDGMVNMGINVFIANGGAAGQQSPHFLIHFLPRDDGDGFDNFTFKGKESLKDEQKKMLQNNLPIMMGNHFKRNPATWHSGQGSVPDFLQDLYNKSTILYEDEKVLCVLPDLGAAPGHIIIYSKVEEKDVTKLSQEDSTHLFFTASFAATAVFEGLGAQATNIILKSGKTEDNPEGRLVLHVIPRSQGDGLEKMMWEPKQPSYDLEGIKSRIKDKTWKVQYKEEKKEVKSPVVLEKVLKLGKSSPQDEIKKAIEGVQ